MTRSYDDFIKETQELFNQLNDSGVSPVEVHNRFALFYMQRLDFEPSDDDVEFPDDYYKTKLIVGTALLAQAQNPDSDVKLHTIKKKSHEKGWFLNHYDAKDVSLVRLIAVVNAAFGNTIGYNPRPCDIRICLQMGSPTLWKNAKVDDFVLKHDRPGPEMERVQNFGTKVDISEVAFSQELRKYIVEHMKFELPKEQELMLFKNIRASLR
jgi:hypothetical protein